MEWDQCRLLRSSRGKGICGLSGEDLQRVCSTVLVKFFIGPSRGEYHLSKALIASLSEPLKVILSGLSSGRGDVNVKPVDWSNLIDADIFNLFVQYAYTGGYNIPWNFSMDFSKQLVLSNHQVYSEARNKNQDAYWIYESSPFVEIPMPASVCRQHAQIWAFATFHKIHKTHNLVEVAEQQLRTALKDLMQSSESGDYFGLEENNFREVVDVIGYIYHQGRRFWGNEIKAEAPLTRSGMRLTVAWFARKYLCDYGESYARQQRAGKNGRNQQNLKIWTSLLEKEPLIAVDMVCHDPKTVAW